MLYQARCHRQGLVARVMIVGKAASHLADGAVLVPQRTLQHLVSRAMEVHVFCGSYLYNIEHWNVQVIFSAIKLE